MFETNKKLFRAILLPFIAFVLLIFAANISAYGMKEDAQAQSLDSLSYFQSFSLRRFDQETGAPSEETFTEKDLASYKVVVFNGWGPWCTACVGEMPELEALAKEYESKGLLVVGIVAGYATNPASNSDFSIQSVLDAYNIDYPILVGDDRFSAEVEPTMGGAYPGTWAVDAEGNLIEYVAGARSESGWRAYFDTWLEGAE